MGVERELECLGLHHVGMDLRSMGKRIDPRGKTVAVHEDDEVQAKLLGRRVAKEVHRLELPRRIDVQERKGGRAGEKAFNAKCSITELSLPIESAARDSHIRPLPRG
jgi:hypothetical protein